jgi:hypothetical protein
MSSISDTAVTQTDSSRGGSQETTSKLKDREEMEIEIHPLSE